MTESDVLSTFETALASWGAEHGLTPEQTRLDDEGMLTVTVLGQVLTLACRPDSETVLLWSECGDVAWKGFFRQALLEQDHFSRTCGFTVAYDARGNRAVILDRRPAEQFTSVAMFDAWFTAGAKLAGDVRNVAQQGIDDDQVLEV